MIVKSSKVSQSENFEILLEDCRFDWPIKTIASVEYMWSNGYRVLYIAEYLDMKLIDVSLIILHLMHKYKEI